MGISVFHTMKCACGHYGKIKQRKSDPLDPVSWCRYSLENLKGKSYYAEGFPVPLKEVIPYLSPVCPRCNRMLSAENLTKG